MQEPGSQCQMCSRHRHEQADRHPQWHIAGHERWVAGNVGRKEAAPHAARVRSCGNSSSCRCRRPAAHLHKCVQQRWVCDAIGAGGLDSIAWGRRQGHAGRILLSADCGRRAGGERRRRWGGQLLKRQCGTPAGLWQGKDAIPRVQGFGAASPAAKAAASSASPRASLIAALPKAARCVSKQ